MASHLTRQKAGNTRGASARCSSRKIRRVLQQYADLVICPRMAQHASVGALNLQRLAAAQRVICTDPSYALDLCQMAGSAPRELPFAFTALDAWRMVVDAMHARMAVAA